MRLAHTLADAVRHEPRRPVAAEAELPPKLMRAHTLFAAAEQSRRQKPLVKRNVRTLV